MELEFGTFKQFQIHFNSELFSIMGNWYGTLEKGGHFVTTILIWNEKISVFKWRLKCNYSGDPYTGRVRYSNGWNVFGYEMVRVSNGIRKPD